MSRETSPCTRRRALHGAAALLAALAGCNGSASSSRRSGGPGTAANVETDPEHVALRTSGDRPAAWIEPEGGRERRERSGSAGSGTANRPWTLRKARGLIASRGTAARLSFADGVDVDGARSFVEGTDFARETLVLDGRRIRECFALDLCYVSWSPTEYHTFFARGYRDADVACRTDARDGLAHLVRIPDALDPARVTGSGSGATSGTCEGLERRRRARRDGTAAGDSTGGGGTRTDAASGGTGGRG